MSKVEISGKKEVIEAVVIAGLTKLATELAQWGIEEAKRKLEECRKTNKIDT